MKLLVMIVRDRDYNCGLCGFRYPGTVRWREAQYKMKTRGVGGEPLFVPTTILICPWCQAQPKMKVSVGVWLRC